MEPFSRQLTMLRCCQLQRYYDVQAVLTCHLVWMQSPTVAEAVEQRYGSPVSKGLSTAEFFRQRPKRLWLWIALSTVLHAPLTPIGHRLGLLALPVRLHHPTSDDALEEHVGIPVEVLAVTVPRPEAATPTAANNHPVVVTPHRPIPTMRPKSNRSIRV